MTDQPYIMFEVPEPRIGQVSASGAVYIGNDQYISDWVVNGAPFRCRQSYTTERWIVADKRDKPVTFYEDKPPAEARAEELNDMALIAIMVRA